MYLLVWKSFGHFYEIFYYFRDFRHFRRFRGIDLPVILCFKEVGGVGEWGGGEPPILVMKNDTYVTDPIQT